MLDQLIAGSPPPRTLRAVAEPGELLEDHAYLREMIAENDRLRSWPEYADWFDDLDPTDRDRLEAWLGSARPWPDAGLTIGECVCHSTIAMCLECHDEQVVEVGHGPGAREEQCACAFAGAA